MNFKWGQTMKKLEVSLVRTEVYDLLKKMILNKELKLGEKLNVRILSDELGISFTPVRDALLQLSSEGLVKVVPRVGFFVVDVDEKFVREITEARIMIEVFCLNTFFDKIRNNKEFLELEDKMLIIKKEKDRRVFNITDKKLHMLIVNSSTNDLIISNYKKIWDRIDLIRHLNERFEKSNDEHLKIVENIKQGVKDKAIEILKEHILNVEKETLKSLHFFEEDNNDN